MWDPFKKTVETFGENGLEKAREEVVEKLRIPDSSKKFLTKVGLPKESILLCEFDIKVAEIPTIQQFGLRHGKTIKCKELLRRIGTDGGMQICISEEKGCGKILTVDLKDEYPDRFINSSIELFIGFLALYYEACKRCQGSVDENIGKEAYKFYDQLHAYDSAAFATSDTWWSIITEQMKVGLL